MRIFKEVKVRPAVHPYICYWFWSSRGELGITKEVIVHGGFQSLLNTMVNTTKIFNPSLGDQIKTYQQFKNTSENPIWYDEDGDDLSDQTYDKMEMFAQHEFFNIWYFPTLDYLEIETAEESFTLIFGPRHSIYDQLFDSINDIPQAEALIDEYLHEVYPHDYPREELIAYNHEVDDYTISEKITRLINENI